jgi:hypothetical protein
MRLGAAWLAEFGATDTRAVSPAGGQTERVARAGPRSQLDGETVVRALEVHLARRNPGKHVA